MRRAAARQQPVKPPFCFAQPGFFGLRFRFIFCRRLRPPSVISRVPAAAPRQCPLQRPGVFQAFLPWCVASAQARQFRVRLTWTRADAVVPRSAALPSHCLQCAMRLENGVL